MVKELKSSPGCADEMVDESWGLTHGGQRRERTVQVMHSLTSSLTSLKSTHAGCHALQPVNTVESHPVTSSTARGGGQREKSERPESPAGGRQ